MAAEPDPDLPPFSPGRFAHARELAAGVEIAPDCAVRLQVQVGDAPWHLVVEGGRVTAWDAGAIESPDAELRWTDDVARRIVTRELRGDEALLATTVVASNADGSYTGVPAPFDLAARAELATMLRVPDATLAAQYRYRRGPFGDVTEVMWFDEGRFVEQRPGETDAADVYVDVTYRALALVRAGEITVIQALEGGAVKGDLGGLAALAGIVESPEFHAAELATGRHSIALSVLGELDAHETFATAMRVLAP
ncbi:MAG TPA: hypothetical protein VFW74_08940 [Acidimicrobiia bacterium]|nr:hypothetical protein [Acidimicrobiia bacterium]